MSFLLLIILSLILSTAALENITLTYSSIASQVIFPVSAPPVQLALYKYPSKITQVPQANWIWAGYANTSDCPMTITIQDQIQITCLMQPVTLYAAADNSFVASFLESTLTGNSWSAPVSLTINPSQKICNGTYTFTITATNQVNSKAGDTGCAGGNYAAVIYGVVQQSPDVCCDNNQSYYNQTTCECYPCSSLFPGCVTCTISSCASCNTAGYFISYGTGCICQSNQYLLNNSLCVSCNQFIVNCTNCSSTTVCLQCSIGSKLNPTTQICQPCGVGCLDCDYTQCFTCDTFNYFQLSNQECICNETSTIVGNTCLLCSSFITNCTKCDNSSYCTQCMNGSMVNANNICQSCKVGCLDCDYVGGCITCDSSNFFKIQTVSNYNQCVCQYSYGLNQSICQSCNLTLIDCVNCDSINSCTECRIGAMLNPSSICQTCPIGCLTCQYIIGCITCNTGYLLYSGVCVAHCGDGILALQQGEQCDDGNNLDGDGCSHDCKIEVNYTCTGIEGYISNCSYNNSFRLFVKWVKKQLFKSIVTFSIGIIPNISNLEYLNFSTATTINNSLMGCQYTYYNNGTLILIYNFNQTLESQYVLLTFDPKSASPLFYATLQSTLLIEMVNNANIPITYYQQGKYSSVQIIRKVIFTSLVLTTALILISFGATKFIGIELILVWQVSFLSLSSIDKVQPILSAIFPIFVVNGYNWIPIMDNRCVPDRVNAIGYSNNMYDNLNFMLFIIYFVRILFPLVTYLFGLIVSKYKEKMKEVSLYIRKEYFTVFVLYEVMNIGYSFGLQLLYGEQNITNYSIMGLSILIICTTLIGSLYCHSKYYGEFSTTLKSNTQSQIYFKMNFIYRLMLGFTLSMFNQSTYVVLYALFLSLFFLIYQLSVRPFIRGYHNYNSILCQLSIIIILGIRMFYRSLKNNYPIVQVSKILLPGYIQIVLIVLCLVAATIVQIYDISQKYCRCGKIKDKTSSRSYIQKQQAIMNAVLQEDNEEIIEFS